MPIQGRKERDKPNAKIVGAISADDLTGACDVGGPFTRFGYKPVISFSLPQTAAGLSIVCTRTRGTWPDLAATTLRRVWPTRVQADWAFLKVDSTLRGNPGAEVPACQDIFGRRAAVVCPAFPAMGRTLLGGNLRVHGAPADPPVDLPSLLQSQGAALAGHWTLEQVRQPGHLAVLAAALVQGGGVCTADAETEADLQALTAALLPYRDKVLFAGSSGWAQELAGALPRGHEETPNWRTGAPGPVLLLIGSRHPATRSQVRRLAASMPLACVGPDWDQQPLAAAALQDGRSILMDIPHGTPPASLSWLRSVLSSPAMRGVVLSGGDTADTVCQGLGVTALEVLGEPWRGLPLCCARDGALAGLPLITKSGGFGGDDSLVAVTRHLAQLVSGDINL